MEYQNVDTEHLLVFTVVNVF